MVIATTVGVTVGKFNPPHLGHLHLIRSAAARLDRLYVLLGDRPGQSIGAEQRAGWLEADSPGNVTVLVTPDDMTSPLESSRGRLGKRLGTGAVLGRCLDHDEELGG